MPFSFRRKPDLEAAQRRIDAEFARKADTARKASAHRGELVTFTPPPYVPPAELYAFRVKYRLSAKDAGALLERSNTWWLFREQGHQLMAPDQFERAKAAAARIAPKATEPEPVTKASLAARVSILEGHVVSLSDQLRDARWTLRRMERLTGTEQAGRSASPCDLL